jgi:hypothetical protein
MAVCYHRRRFFSLGETRVRRVSAPIVAILVVLGQGCAPMETYTFQVVDSETKAPVSAVETYCMSASWQPSKFLGIPTPCYFPVNVNGYTNDTGMVRVSNVWVFQHLLFEKPGYEPVAIDRTWPQIAASSGSNRGPVDIQETKGLIVVPMTRKTQVAETQAGPVR